MYFKPSGGRSQENKNFVKDQYMENLWKSQVFVAHSTVSAELFAETFHPPLQSFVCIETTYWWTVLVHQCDRREIGFFFFYKSYLFSLESQRTCTYPYFLKPEMVKWLKIKRRDFFFNETGFLFWCYALCKLGSLNCYVFEMRHASGLETTRIFLLFIFKLV